MKQFISFLCIFFSFSLTANAETKFEYYVDTNSPDILQQDNLSKELLLQPLKGDVIMGNKDAKVTMIEYSSLSCPHCSIYHNEMLPVIYEEYIKTGKILYIYRDFPTTQSALMASLVMNYKTTSTMDFANAFFKNQNLWAFRPDFKKAISDIAKLSGLKSDEIKSILEDNKKADNILRSSFKAAEILDINGTPIFIINGHLTEGLIKLEDFKKNIDAALS